MAANNVQAVLFTSHHNINYCSDFVYCRFGRDYGLVVTQDACTTITANIDGGQLTEKLFEQPTAESLTGATKTRSHVFYQGEEQKITSGTWECEPGRSRWEFTTRGEVIYVLSTAHKMSDLRRAVANS
jgi:hypothetical protein